MNFDPFPNEDFQKFNDDFNKEAKRLQKKHKRRLKLEKIKEWSLVALILWIYGIIFFIALHFIIKYW